MLLHLCYDASHGHMKGYGDQQKYGENSTWSIANQGGRECICICPLTFDMDNGQFVVTDRESRM